MEIRRLDLICNNGKKSITFELAKNSPVLAKCIDKKWINDDVIPSFNLDCDLATLELYINYQQGSEVKTTEQLINLCKFLGVEMSVNILDGIIETVAKEVHKIRHFNNFLDRKKRLASYTLTAIRNCATKCQEGSHKIILDMAYEMLRLQDAVLHSKEHNWSTADLIQKYYNHRDVIIAHPDCDAVLETVKKLILCEDAISEKKYEW